MAKTLSRIAMALVVLTAVVTVCCGKKVNCCLSIVAHNACDWLSRIQQLPASSFQLPFPVTSQMVCAKATYIDMP